MKTGTFVLRFEDTMWTLWKDEKMIAWFVAYEFGTIERVHKAVRAYIGPLAGIEIEVIGEYNWSSI